MDWIYDSVSWDEDEPAIEVIFQKRKNQLEIICFSGRQSWEEQSCWRLMVPEKELQSNSSKHLFYFPPRISVVQYFPRNSEGKSDFMQEFSNMLKTWK